MSDMQTITIPKSSAPKMTVPSGDRATQSSDRATPVVDRAKPDRGPRIFERRPWLQFALNRDTNTVTIGKDGVTVDEMPWVFDIKNGVCRFGCVEMVSVQNRQTGAYSKPRPRGEVAEAKDGYPVLSLDECRKIYDLAEAKNLSVREAVVITLDVDKYTKEQLRKIAAAPDVHVLKETATATQRSSEKHLDSEVERIRSLS